MLKYPTILLISIALLAACRAEEHANSSVKSKYSVLSIKRTTTTEKENLYFPDVFINVALTERVNEWELIMMADSIIPHLKYIYQTANVVFYLSKNENGSSWATVYYDNRDHSKSANIFGFSKTEYAKYIPGHLTDKRDVIGVWLNSREVTTVYTDSGNVYLEAIHYDGQGDTTQVHRFLKGQKSDYGPADFIYEADLKLGSSLGLPGAQLYIHSIQYFRVYTDGRFAIWSDFNDTPRFLEKIR